MSARTDTAAIPVIDGEAWDVTDGWRTTRYARRSHRDTFAASGFAAHLRAASRAAFLPAVLCSLYVVGLAVGDLVRVAL